MKTTLLTLGLLLAAAPAFAAENVTPQMLATYKGQGAGAPNADHGKAMWTQTKFNQEAGKDVNCATCHGTDLSKAGKHAKTGKEIGAMSPKVNPERYTDAAKIEKWFGRNCKWTYGRECTAQEKADFLAFLNR